MHRTSVSEGKVCVASNDISAKVFRAPRIRIKANGKSKHFIAISKSAMILLHYPSYVRLMWNAQTKMLYVSACEEGDAGASAIHTYTSKYGSEFNLHGKCAIQYLLTLMNRPPHMTCAAQGVFYAEEKMLGFDFGKEVNANEISETEG